MSEAKDHAQLSDGYHTFAELYEHRHANFIALCYMLFRLAQEQCRASNVWRSMKHADGTMFDGWFIMGINQEPGYQITYHLPVRLWNETAFAQNLKSAPEWDGHSSSDVLTRLYKLAGVGWK